VENDETQAPTGRTASLEEGALWPYVKSSAVYVCPSNATGEEKRLSYSMNCAIAHMSNARVRSPSELCFWSMKRTPTADIFMLSILMRRTRPGLSPDALTQVHNGGRQPLVY
jgi:hypothetical protein